MVWMDALVVVMTVTLVGAGVWYKAHTRTASQNGCTAPGAQHKLTVANNTFSSTKLEVKRCATIMIVNMGSEDYELAFGVHQQHVFYPGFSMQLLRPHEYFMLDAVRSGRYNLHDHLRDKASVSLIIKD